MKRLIGLLLTCTAFAYQGERIVMELPPEIAGYSEFESSTRYICCWEGDEDSIKVSSNFQDPENIVTIASYLEGDLEVLELIDQSPNSATLFSVHQVTNSCCCGDQPCEPQEVTVCEKVIVTDDSYHVIQSENLDWLSYVQTAEIGIPEMPNYYEGPYLTFITADWKRMIRDENENELMECWHDRDGHFFISLSNTYLDCELTLQEILDKTIAEFEEEFTIQYQVMEQSNCDQLIKIVLEGQGISFSGYLRLILTDKTLHVAFGICQDDGALLDIIKNLELAQTR